MSAVTLLVLKVVISAAMVITVTMVAEKGSARLAGVLMGFPLGSGLTFFFIGVEQGPQFAADAALWAIPGIITGLFFCLAYSWVSQYCQNRKLLCILLATSAGTLCYVISSLCLLNYLSETPLARGLTVIIGVPLLAYLFQLPAQNEKKPTTKARIGIWILFIRAGFAASVVILITAVAQSVGPAWSGLFATFPITILPSVLILHYANGSALIPHLFRETAFGMIAIAVFSTAVNLSFPQYGVYLGIFLSYLVAFSYLFIYEFFLRKNLRKLVTPT